MRTRNGNGDFPRLKGIVVIVGAYGSGKTEVAINLALGSRRFGLQVWIADLDLVNPYFRTREARIPLTEKGIGVVLPPDAYLKADLPILSPQVAGVIRRSDDLVLLDVGGNDAGATVLAALADAFRDANDKGRPLKVLLVVNPFRPFTETLSGCQKMRDSIEKASKLTVTGVIGNANLMEETRTKDIEDGYRFARALSVKTSLPLEMITVPLPLLGHIEKNQFSCPVLPIDRHLAFPWKSAGDTGYDSGFDPFPEDEGCLREDRAGKPQR